MFQELSRDERLLLLRFVCAFAWTDLEIKDGERRCHLARSGGRVPEWARPSCSA
jgi:hypothetical protein